MKYRKKPVVIDAIQLGSSPESLEYVLNFVGSSASAEQDGGEGHCVLIETLEGTMRADQGDWIIKGVKDEFYPCKPAIFEATYEPAE